MKIPQNPPKPNTPSVDVATQQWVSTYYAQKLGLPPGYEFSYSQITSTVNVTGTVEATPTTIIAGSSFVFDGAPVIAEFFAPYVIPPAVAGQAIIICLWEGATEIGRLLDTRAFAAQAAPTAAIGKYRFSPTAGPHTYSVKAFASSTTGTPQVGAGPTGVANDVPAYLRITKV